MVSTQFLTTHVSFQAVLILHPFQFFPVASMVDNVTAAAPTLELRLPKSIISLPMGINALYLDV